MRQIPNTKFIQLLKTLSKPELKAFDIWLRSPWCNSNKSLIRLLEMIKKHHPDFDRIQWGKEALFGKIFPQGKYSDRRVNNLLSEAFLTLERFLVFQRFAENEKLQRELLIEEWQGRYFDHWFESRTQKSILELEQIGTKSWEDHLDLLKLYRRIYHGPQQNKRYQPGDPTILKMDQELDLLYLLEKATILNEKIFRNRILKNETHLVEEEVKSWLQISKKYDHPAINLFRRRFLADKNKLEEYHALRNYFFEIFETLNEKQKKVHLQSLFNDTSLLIRTGLLDITDALPLYKLGLSSKVIFHQGLLPYNIFTSIIAASNTQGDFQFSVHVIDNYSLKIELQFQTDAIHWSKAHTLYWQKSYDQALDILSKYDFSSLYFQLLSKVLNTQLYFDLYLNDPTYESYLFNYFDAFERWLSREKLRAKFNKQSFLRFVQLTRALAKYDIDVNAKPQALDKLLRMESNVQALNWLRQQQKTVQKRKK